ncbi:endonuclease V [Halorhodospira halophila]|nr:endonuclease V [Halorhodospira halophila]
MTASRRSTPPTPTRARKPGAGGVTWPCRIPHPWRVDAAEGARIQRQLHQRVRLANDLPPVVNVAGVDVGFPDGGATACAAVARYSWPGFELQESRQARRPVEMPYRPGLLSFRELPAILDALAGLETLPELLLCDGQGVAHPRRLGIAAHLGVLLERPSIGVGKSRLIGSHAAVAEARGARTPLYDGQERIGTVLRTRARVRPVYVSPGHRLDYDTAAAWVMACCTRYRLPEPIRTADRLASRGG